MTAAPLAIAAVTVKKSGREELQVESRLAVQLQSLMINIVQIACVNDGAVVSTDDWISS